MLQAERTILCAGAGHFAVSNITLTDGAFVGTGDEAGAAVIRRLDEISSRTGDMVPQYGFTQAEREVASATTLREESSGKALRQIS